MARNLLPDGYDDFLRDLKERVRQAQIRAALSVNRELVLLYWRIGRDILVRQSTQGWGARVIDRLSRDLREAFPEMKGFSPRNLKYMRAFAEAYQDEVFVQEVLAQISWYHNITLLDKVANAPQRQWYIEQTIEHGWSRNVLVHQIESDLYHRQGAAVTNFERTLPPPQSDLARQMLKDPYVFNFLSLGRKRRDATWNVRSSYTCAISCWSWASASRSSAASIIWRSADKTSTWTCCSTIFGCAVMSSSN